MTDLVKGKGEKKPAVYFFFFHKKEKGGGVFMTEVWSTFFVAKAQAPFSSLDKAQTSGRNKKCARPQER